MGIGRNNHGSGHKQYAPCELYPLSVWQNTKRLTWSRDPDEETPNQLTDYQLSQGAQVATSDVIRHALPTESALWWTITAWAREAVRAQTGPGIVDPLSDGMVLAGYKATPIQLRLRLRAELVYIDIGAGMQFSVLAQNAGVDLWVPGDRVLHNANRKMNVNQDGSSSVSGLDLSNNPVGVTRPVFDTDIDLNITASTAPVGRVGPVTCTRTYDPANETDVPSEAPGAPAPVAGDFEIPPRAKRVQFAVRNEDGAPTTGVGARFLSDPVSRFDRGAVEQWDVGARERTSPYVDIPGNASIVDLSELAGSIVTAVWELDL